MKKEELALAQRRRLKEIEQQLSRLRTSILQSEVEELQHEEHLERCRKNIDAAKAEIKTREQEQRDLYKEFGLDEEV